MSTLRTFRLSPLVDGPPSSVVIFLHGLGDSGSGGLLEICKMWQPFLPTTEFLCPDAPFAFDMAPAEFGGRQWFSLREFTKQSVEGGVKQAAPILNDYIDEILKHRNLPPSKLALVGFSQGTMMALYVALRRKNAVAGVLGYSGILVDIENLQREKISAPPVLLIHGTDDEVVPFLALEAASQALRQSGIDIQSLACPGVAHSIDNAGIGAGLAFLQKILA